jgi:putative transposase
VYGAPPLDAAEAALDELEATWGKKYPGSIKPWRAHWGRLSTFFKYPQELRSIIYTINAIESLNSVLRKNTSSKKQLRNDGIGSLNLTTWLRL